MPSYFKNNQSKPPTEAFGGNQIVILLQKPKSVNLPPKSIIKSLWWVAEKWIKNDLIEIDDYFPFDFINFNCPSSNFISQYINRDAESLKEISSSLRNQLLSMVDDLSSKQEKIDWNIQNILVCRNCLSLTKELTNEKIPKSLGNQILSK